MPTVYQDMLAGRPLFAQEKATSTTPAFLAGNALLHQLKPSKTKAKIWRVFEAVLNWIGQFFKISHPDVMRAKLPWVIRSGGSYDKAPTSLSFGNLWSHYQRFLKKEAFSSSLETSFKRLEQDEAIIQRLRGIDPQDPKKKTEQSKLVQTTHQDILKLKEGQSYLALLNRAPTQDGSVEGRLFCKIAKRGGHYTIRLIGDGSLMRELQAVPVAGKEKVMRELYFDQVPESALRQGDWLKKLLTQWANDEPVTPKSFLETSSHLSPYKKETDAISDLMTGSDKTQRVFWNVVKAFQAEGRIKQPGAVAKAGVEEKRLQFRSECLTLFDLFQQIRYDLKPHTLDYQILSHVFEGISAKASLAYRKGYLKQDELAQLTQELAVIEKAMQEAKKDSLVFPSKVTLKKASIPDVAFKDLPLQARQPVEHQSKNLGNRAEGRKPAEGPIQIPGLTAIPSQLHHQMATKEDFLHLFRKKFDHVSRLAHQRSDQQVAVQDMVRLFHEVPYNISLANNAKNDQSFWWHFTPEEAREIMDKINQVTQTAVNLKEKASLSQYEFESYVRMTQCVSFLHARVTGNWIISWDGEDLIDDYKREYLSDRHSLRRLHPHVIQFKRETEFLRTQFRELRVVASEGIQGKLHYVFQDGSKLSEEDVKHPHLQAQLLLKLIKSSNWRDSLDITSFTFKKVAWDSWMRKIQSPFLKALYKYAKSDPMSNNWADFVKKHEERKEGPEGKGLNTPEAFHDNPEGIFRYYLEQVNRKSDTSSSAQDAAVLSFTPEEMRRLLRLLREKFPQVELMAFMRESPHLMRQADVRNFFDALFFDNSLAKLFSDHYRHSDLIKNIPDQLEGEIRRLQGQLDQVLQAERIEDRTLFKERLETLLYYYDMKERLRDIYAQHNLPIDRFPSSKDDLAAWRLRCEQRPELKKTLSTAARAHLRCLLQSHQAADLPEILKSYALIMGQPKDERNTDPYFEEELQRQWQLILHQSETSGSSMHVFLDQLCYGKDLPLDESAWQKVGYGLYRNAAYEVNLKTLEVFQVGQGGAISYLPPSLVQNADLQSLLGLDLQSVRATVQTSQSTQVFSFQDGAGTPVQLEDLGEGQYRLYKKCSIEGGKWLQVLTKKAFSQAALANLNKQQEALRQSGWRGALSAFANFKKLTETKAEAAFLTFFNHGVYRDPVQPSVFYCPNEAGQVIFKLNVKETSEGLRIEKITDLRTSPASEWQLAETQDLEHPVVQALSSFENKDNLVLWCQKGSLKKIELLRYGVSFHLQNGQLVCLDEPFKGYSVDLMASLQDKKGLPHALVLQHPDPTKPKKLLVADAKAIETTHEPVFPEGRGFAKMALLLSYLKMGYDLIRHRQFPKFDFNFRRIINPSLTQLTLTVVDLRPYTGEICETRQKGESHLLQLITQALKIDQPALAFSFLKKMPVYSAATDPQLFKIFMRFIQTSVSQSGGEAALKLKLCLSLKAAIKQQRKMKRDIKMALNTQIMHLGKEVFAYGRKLPQELQLTEADRLELARLFKKHDRSYYDQHISAYFLSPGQAVDGQTPPATRYDERWAAYQPQRPPSDYQTRIDRLEQKVAPVTRLADDDLAYAIPRLSQPQSLLPINQADIDKLFLQKTEVLPSVDVHSFPARTSCEAKALSDYQTYLNQFKQEETARKKHVIWVDNRALKGFVNKHLLPVQQHYTHQVAHYQVQIEQLVRTSTKGDEQLAIYAGEKPVATLEDLRKALAQNTLSQLQQEGRLPSTLDLAVLRNFLILYFDALVRKNAASSASQLIEDILAKGQRDQEEEWQSLSEALYRLLHMQRHYDPQQDPRLLVFEAQQFMTLKPLDGGLDQLSLLDALVKNPYAVIQAPTGAGKTSVLSVMRSLFKANGKNLVVQKVLPALYQQTQAKLQEVLGDLYGTAVYPFRFNLKMRLVKQEVIKVTNAEGKVEEKKEDHSLFRSLYHDLLDTISRKGCVLTDYKSLPLLEEMFFKVGQELLEKSQQGAPFTPLLEEHFTYLRKILLLLGNKGDVNMDEFDQPNRPIQKIQIDLGVGSHPLPPFFSACSLEIYDMLEKDPQLGLLKNIQGDLSEETRQQILERTAAQLAARLAQEAGNSGLVQPLLAYLLGKTEEVLPLVQHQPPAFLDRLALYKDQFSIYLPLTLRFKEGSRYQRSEEGSRILPCYNGEKHDAKFGALLEQVNYTIQSYLQTGITLHDLKPWIQDLKKRWEEAADQQEKAAHLNRFHEILPGLSLIEVAYLMHEPQEAQKFVERINQDLAKVKVFLNRRLGQIKTSGALISMDPQNIIYMDRAVSGVSATMGAPDSLHRQFKVDHEQNGRIQAGMIYRLQKRAGQQEVILYDPENPAAMLQQAGPVQAFIDGAGAFKKASDIAQALKASNPSLEQVGYHQEDETLAFMGSTHQLEKMGFAFSQSHTRGTDILLGPRAKAVLTLNERDGISEYFQKEGRLRREGQRYKLAMPRYQGIQSVSQAIAHAIAQESVVHAQDIFRKSKQELRAIIRHELKKQLLVPDTIQGFLALFQNDAWRQYFVTRPEPYFADSGSYFAARQHIQFENQMPGTVLQAFKEQMIQEAQALGVPAAVEKLEAVNYDQEILAKMPALVAPLGAAQGELETEVQVEQEQESEQEQELELETQTQQVRAEQRSLGTYPFRMLNEKKVMHAVAEKIHPAYSPLLHVTDDFLPFSRVGTQSLHQRRPFEESMYRVGQVYFDIDIMNDKIKKAIIQDPLEDFYISNGLDMCYDIRTDQLIHAAYGQACERLRQTPAFVEIIAQIKFLDGRLSGYSDRELQALEAWLRAHDPQRMQAHLLGDILRHRESDRQAFAGSQLQRLFQRLGVNG